MNHTRATRIVFLIALTTLTLSALAKDPPAMIYVKEKCALCHAKDGSADTPAGKQTGARDFSLPEVRSLSDATLATTIAEGKGKMPGFKARLSADDIDMLIRYVRELGSRND